MTAPAPIDPGMAALLGELDALVKAGFSRGGGRGAHKYWKRVRRVVKGKLGWVYYYNTERDRRRWLEDRARQIEGHKAAVETLKETHRDKGAFQADHPELVKARRELKALTVEYLDEMLGWGKPPEVHLSENALAQYHEAILELYQDGEPDPPHGKPMSALRACEMAFERIPPRLREYFSGAIAGLNLVEAEDVPYMRGKSAVGLCWAPRGKDAGSKIDVALDRSEPWGSFGGAHYRGGTMTMEVILHEMGHAFHNAIGCYDDRAPEGWDGPVWAGWEAMLKAGGKAEPGITSYAETNEKERFAESFACALTYPRELAAVAPLAYAWMRDFLGHDALRPANTDEAAVAPLRKRLERAIEGGDRKEIRDLEHQIDMLTGVLDMPADDPRLQWWKNPETSVQARLREAEKPTYANIYRRDPPDTAKIPPQDAEVDRFYEMNVGGRTIFVRVGPAGPGQSYSGWRPGDPVAGRIKPKATEIKEVYDAEGNPLGDKHAWWYLNQDEFVDGHPDSDGLLGFDLKPKDDAENYKLIRKHALNEKLVQVTTKANPAGKKRPDPFSQRAEPVEITADDFRLRSGAFAYDAWDMAGHRERDALRTETDPEKRTALMEAFTKKQPWVERIRPRDPKTGRFLKTKVMTAAVKHGEQPVPVMQRIRYVNDNPDGTKTVIEVVRDKSGDASRSGRFFIDSPLWAELLTPRGEDVRSPEHLAQLCRDAAQEKRTAWVSVKADVEGGGEPHYYHVQVQFDGRGQPLVVGDFWKKRLGSDQPRLDDLLKLGTISGASRESERATPRAVRAVTGSDDVRVDPVTGGAEVRVPAADLPAAAESLRNAGYIVDIVSDGAGGRGPAVVLAHERVAAGVRETSRPRLGAEPIRRQARWEVELAAPPAEGELAVLTVSGAERGTRSDKDVIAQLVDILPGKPAGEIPPFPKADDALTAMPRPRKAAEAPVDVEGSDGDTEPAKPAGPVLTLDEARWKRLGALPDDYVGDDRQRKWLDEAFRPLVEEWERTKEAAKEQEWPERYVFRGAPGGGAPGRRFVRQGAEHVLQTTRRLWKSTTPEPLEHDLLVYMHERVHPVTGVTIDREPRLLLPKNGVITRNRLDGMHGVRLGTDPDGEPYIGINMEGFAKLRAKLGGLSLTGDAEAHLRSNADSLKAAAERVARGEHFMEVDDIDPAKLAERGVGVVSHLPDGNRFELAEHQQELIQTALDNDGRVLGAHYMGTGKTVSTIVLAKMMLSSVMPEEKRCKKVLVVAPLNTIDQWADAADTFDDGCTVVGARANDIPIDEYIKAVKEGRDNNDLVVVGPEYWTIHADKLKAAGFDGLAIDEAHFGLRDATAERNQALRKWNPDMKMLALLTGTPVTTSPADVKEYIEILSGGEVWAGMTRSQWINEYLEESPVPAALGVVGKKGPKTVIKASKRAEVASLVGQYTHVALPKDVRGKTLPAVRIEESKHAEMVGIQAALYAYQMAAISDDQKAKMAGSAVLGDDETAGLSDEAKRSLLAAKAIANCPAYKPPSKERYIRVTLYETATGGEVRADLKTFDPAYLFAASRGKEQGRWPSMAELGHPSVAAAYDAWLNHVTGTTNYSELAGTKITPEQREAMVADGWPRKVDNPDAGPVGIRCRGADDPAPPHPDAAAALAFQRQYAIAVKEGVGKDGRPAPFGVNLSRAAQEAGLDLDTAERYLTIHPNPTVHREVVRHGGVSVAEGERWVSDTRGSLHLLYHPDDWDEAAGKPKPGAPSLMHPGRRDERAKADVAMFVGNAKAEELRAYITNFHQDTAPDDKGSYRQMVLFANGILDGCRSIEATLRVMGYRDVNEVIKGSPLHDPDDPTLDEDGLAPNGKYFVTYIGSTFTGNRDLNVDVFKKTKDRLGRDSDESVFVNKCEAPGPARKVQLADGSIVQSTWSTYPGDAEDHGVALSQWTPESRAQIKENFGIDAPESFVRATDGSLRFFYGDSKKRTLRLPSGERLRLDTAGLLREIVLTGDPTKMDPDAARAARERIAALKQEYAERAHEGAATDPPLTDRQRTVFNNCEMIVCSDAAQVGMNLGNAAELVMYDSLGSPMAEWQRITRSARMLPPAVKAKLMGTPEAPGPFRKIRDQEPQILDPGPRGGPQGWVRGFEIRGASDLGKRGDYRFGQALSDIELHAAKMAEETKGQVSRLWAAIEAKATVAQTLGPTAAIAAFEELAKTGIPGGTANLIAFKSYDLSHSVEAGTYADVEVNEPSAAVARAIAGLSAAEQQAIADAGFTSGDGMPDPAAVYLAIRADEVLRHIEEERPRVAQRLRGSSAGAVVTDADVMNAVIDSLSPQDRAVLKTKKYLVNVRRIGVSAHVPQVARFTSKDEDGGREKHAIFTGYEKEHPIAPERNTRATGRARMTAVEKLMADIQEGVTVRTELDYSTVGAADIAAASRTDLEKALQSLRLGLPRPRLPGVPRA